MSDLKRIALLISPEGWLMGYKDQFVNKLEQVVEESVSFYSDHKSIDSSCDVLFILIYFRLIDWVFGILWIWFSDSWKCLPQGKEWAPFFWQILEEKSEIPFTLFEATEGVDSGDVWLRDVLYLDGSGLCEDLHKKQALFSINMWRIQPWSAISMLRKR